MASVLGSELLARSGDPESLWLIYGLDSGVLHGWLALPTQPIEIVAEF
jgi:hypothetical protein